MLPLLLLMCSAVQVVGLEVTVMAVAVAWAAVAAVVVAGTAAAAAGAAAAKRGAPLLSAVAWRTNDSNMGRCKSIHLWLCANSPVFVVDA